MCHDLDGSRKELFRAGADNFVNWQVAFGEKQGNFESSLSIISDVMMTVKKRTP